MVDKMINVLNLTKHYGNKFGVRNLNFNVAKGEILGFLGPNGAGKSTTMNIITGYKPPSHGRVLIDGIDIQKNPIDAKRKIGYLPEIPPIYHELKVYSYLKFVCELKGVERNKQELHIKEIMELVKISDVSSRLIKNLSKGYKQRVGLAQALISNPEVIIMDEPTVGLDPKQILEIRSLIKGLGGEHTVILSSHILSEVSMICERVIILNKGEIAAIDTPNNLALGLASTEKFLVKIKGQRNLVLEAIKDIEGVVGVEMNNVKDGMDTGFTNFIIENRKYTDVKTPLFFKMSECGNVIHEMKDLDISLEEIFLQLTNEDSIVDLEVDNNACNL
jgi:ABC-2 type transport system ATP-binding protein